MKSGNRTAAHCRPRQPRRHGFTLGLVVAVLTASAAIAKTNTITIRSFSLSQQDLKIVQYDTVTWLNLDVAGHGVTSDDAVWTSPVLSQNASYSFVFTNTGKFNYHLDPPTSIRGSVTVRPVPAPTVEIQSPTNSQEFFAPANVRVLVDATTVNGSVTNVEFLLGTNRVLRGHVTNAPFAFTLTNLAVGDYQVQTRAYDNHGSNTLSAAVVFSVVPPLRLLNPRVTDAASFAFTITGAANVSNLVYVSTNLSNWAAFITNQPSSSNTPVTDPEAAGFPQRFYRVVTVP